MSNKLITIISVLCAALVLCPLSAHADENLAYAGEPAAPSNMQTGTYPGQAQALPADYSTNYSAQYSPYASFMQSPYGSNGGYPADTYGAGYAGGPGTPGVNVDPYAASEVSPYAHYSPYIEVIGDGSDYTLGIDDVITVIVRNQPDFSGRYVVDPEGNIQYNFVGDIPAVGKTKEQLKADISEALKKYVRFPEVAVMISEYRSKNVYVFGFVNRPGKYAMKGNHITVKEAIVAAGLTRMDGSMERVYVIRPSEFTDDGEAGKKKVDLQKLLYKGDSAEDFILKPGDTIVVHQKYFDKFVNAFSRLVGPIFQASAVYELAYGDKDGYLK